MIQLVLILVLIKVNNLEAIISNCNITIEALPGQTKQVLNPYIKYEDQGSSLTCWYTIRTKPSLVDLSISLEFDRFSIGNLQGNICREGYLKILDSKHSRVNDGLGQHCGSINQPKRVVRQTDTMKLIFVSTNLSRNVEWRFTIRALSKTELPQRFGSHSQYFPGRIGAVVEGTYCETVFQDCREQNCYVQSPGFPGVYPRGVSCRYYLSTKTPLIRMYIEGLYWDAFNVDSRRCENYLECEMRQLSENCPYDYVSIYDGLDEYSPLIGKFCGAGFFPQSIVGRSNRMFVEFVSSSSGPLMNTGFDFRITSLPSSDNGLMNSTCHQEIQSSQLNGKDEGTLLSVEHWYPPGTNCSYLLKGTLDQVVRLYFVKMKIVEKDHINQSDPRDCNEYLALYDSNWPDPRKIIKVFCDGIPKEDDKVNYISRSSNMLVNFVSKIGSYSGSSIYYWGVFDFHDTHTQGHKVAGTACDEEFTNVTGAIHSPANSLVYLNPTRDVVCNYRIQTNPLKYGRISLLLEHTNFKENKQNCSVCASSAVDHIQILYGKNVSGTDSVDCYSACANQNRTEVISSGPSISINLFIVKSTATSNYFKKKPPIFKAKYTFLHPAVCGPTVIKAVSPGYMRFPDLSVNKFDDVDVYCIWDVLVPKDSDLQLTIGNITMKSKDCAQHSVAISSGYNEVHKECGQTKHKKDLIVPGRENSGVVKVGVRMKSLNLGRFDLSWKY